MGKKSSKKTVNIFKGESNPFNMKINREKRCILGQKVKGTRGFRGFSRAESHAKRKELWQKTRVLVEKANKFVDKRLMNGEDDGDIDRLVLERKNKLKKNVFNLNEESLTHKGMPLDEVKTFNNDDSDDEEQLNATYVNQAHFGGFGSESKEPKSHKEVMEELIVESKKKKYEKKMEKEVNQDLTEKLDKEWKDILSVVGGMKFGSSTPASEKPDPYILLTNQLKFEKRGTPVSRTKTAEELEKEEKERLEKLEAERLRRMNPVVPKRDHLSADALYDDFDFEPIPVEDDAEETPATQEESEFSNSSKRGGSEKSVKESTAEMSLSKLLDTPLSEVCISSLPSTVLKYLDLEFEHFQECKKLNKKRNFPRSECIRLLKYISVTFSVSDYRHPVVTPAMIFMCDILSSKFRITTLNIIYRLFVCHIFADCVSQSKRFVPDAIVFLVKVLQLAIPVETKITSNETKKQEIDLVVHKKPSSSEVGILNLVDPNLSVLDDSKKLTIISKTISTLHRYATFYTDLDSFPEIFSKTLHLCSQLPTSYYGDSLKDSITSLMNEIKKERVRTYLSYQNTKPKPLKLFEPAFESKFSKKNDTAKKFKLLKRVSQKIKKEERSVLREMRRDARMIAAEKLKETLESDAERKRKVKELYHELATQEGEYKKMMKKKT